MCLACNRCSFLPCEEKKFSLKSSTEGPAPRDATRGLAGCCCCCFSLPDVVVVVVVVACEGAMNMRADSSRGERGEAESGGTSLDGDCLAIPGRWLIKSE